MLTNHIRLVLRLRVSGVLRPLFLYAIITCKGILYVPFLYDIWHIDHINANEMQLFFYFLCLVLRAVHVSDALCVHHQEHCKM